MTSLCFWMHGIATTDPGLSVSRAELSYVGGRVMDSRTTGLEVLRGVVQEDMPGAWLWVSGTVPYARWWLMMWGEDAQRAAPRCCVLVPRSGGPGLAMQEEAPWLWASGRDSAHQAPPSSADGPC